MSVTLNALDYSDSAESTSSTFTCLKALSPAPVAIGRYYDASGTTSPSSKALTLSEAQAIHGAGFKIFTDYEESGGQGYAPCSYFTTAQGQSDLANALGQAAAAQQPTQTTIFFAVDVQITASSDMTCVIAYFQSILNNMPLNDALIPDYWVGVYGH